MSSQEGQHTPLLETTKQVKGNLGVTFAPTTAAAVAGLLALFAVFVRFDVAAFSDAHVNQYYMWYMHVAIMIFVGFGFLMTFLRHYSYSALGLNFFCSCLVMLAAIVAVGCAQQVVGKGKSVIDLDLPLLIDAAFCAGATMITFGAVLGKVSPTQLMLLLLIEVPLYACNQHIVAEMLGALDVGGSITIHAFGAYYGLAASLVMSPKGSGASHEKNGAIYSTDMTAMIGTIFLWMFWPSFNGALASAPAAAYQPQFLCIMNTNATLAGGVAVGSAANMSFLPVGAVTLGIIAGLLSTSGYRFLTPWLEERIGLRDTCGVHNLHGMPGLLGGLTAALVAFFMPVHNRAVMAHSTSQAMYQLAGVGATLVLAIIGGTIAGEAIAAGTPASLTLQAEEMYEDAMWWEEVESEKPEEDLATGARL
ncbi:hypothetical protein WJX74_001012 [Apatococcus lobatus]|uniref:Ammonium transporter AmtB-like domain-containing protein n=1 Tax=Apatococcus lobatus TaxID=904363 RepID=A0AAW1PZN3_9CHLO